MLGLDLDDNNDIHIDEKTGNIALVQDIDAVKVAVLCATKTNYGEIQLNTQFGVPYFETIFVAHPDIELWKSYMKEAILSIPKVLNISYFATYIENSLLKYAVVINTEYGQGEINV